MLSKLSRRDFLAVIGVSPLLCLPNPNKLRVAEENTWVHVRPGVIFDWENTVCPTEYEVVYGYQNHRVTLDGKMVSDPGAPTRKIVRLRTGKNGFIEYLGLEKDGSYILINDNESIARVYTEGHVQYEYLPTRLSRSIECTKTPQSP